jgi:hypothetical protein
MVAHAQLARLSARGDGGAFVNRLARLRLSTRSKGATVDSR